MPDCVYQMGNLRIVDLTKVLDPENGKPPLPPDPL